MTPAPGRGIARGVVVSFAACENTMRKQNIAQVQLMPFVTTVDSGVAEVVRKRAAGRAYVKGAGEPMKTRRAFAFLLIVLLTLLLPQLAYAGGQAGTHSRDYSGAAWSPYLVGGGIGVLSWLTFYFSDKAIGASSGYATLAGFLGRLVAPRHTASLEYYKENPPKLNWELVFVAFVIAGSFVAASTGGEITNEWLHPMWIARFGDSVALRAVVGFAGGVFMAFGARLAGGCTSGHGISGTLQLNVASWVAVICMFIGGIATAMLLFRV